MAFYIVGIYVEFLSGVIRGSHVQKQLLAIQFFCSNYSLLIMNTQRHLITSTFAEQADRFLDIGLSL